MPPFPSYPKLYCFANAKKCNEEINRNYMFTGPYAVKYYLKRKPLYIRVLRNLQQKW